MTACFVKSPFRSVFLLSLCNGGIFRHFGSWGHVTVSFWVILMAPPLWLPQRPSFYPDSDSYYGSRFNWQSSSSLSACFIATSFPVVLCCKWRISHCVLAWVIKSEYSELSVLKPAEAYFYFLFIFLKMWVLHNVLASSDSLRFQMSILLQLFFFFFF